MRLAGLALVAAAAAAATMQTPAPPYPPSSIIASVEFDFTTHQRHAPGSDNWPTTWGDDGHLYSAWGDGGGFGGTNSEGRVLLGVARVEGDPPAYTGTNVWGGAAPGRTATFGGKSYGILSVSVEGPWRDLGPGRLDVHVCRRPHDPDVPELRA